MRTLTTSIELEAVLVVVMALLSVLITDQACEPATEPVWIVPFTDVDVCGANTR